MEKKTINPHNPTLLVHQYWYFFCVLDANETTRHKDCPDLCFNCLRVATFVCSDPAVSFNPTRPPHSSFGFSLSLQNLLISISILDTIHWGFHDSLAVFSCRRALRCLVKLFAIKPNVISASQHDNTSLPMPTWPSYITVCANTLPKPKQPFNECNEFLLSKLAEVTTRDGDRGSIGYKLKNESLAWDGPAWVPRNGKVHD
jgi:hypothetical protein